MSLKDAVKLTLSPENAFHLDQIAAFIEDRTDGLPNAVWRFLGSIRKSKERGDEWLSDKDAVEMIRILYYDGRAADAYIVFADYSDEGLMRYWVQRQLAHRGGNS